MSNETDELPHRLYYVKKREWFFSISFITLGIWVLEILLTSGISNEIQMFTSAAGLLFCCYVPINSYYRASQRRSQDLLSEERDI